MIDRAHLRARKLKASFIQRPPYNAARPHRASAIKGHGQSFRQISGAWNLNASARGIEISHDAVDQ